MRTFTHAAALIGLFAVVGCQSWRGSGIAARPLVPPNAAPAPPIDSEPRESVRKPLLQRLGLARSRKNDTPESPRTTTFAQATEREPFLSYSEFANRNPRRQPDLDGQRDDQRDVGRDGRRIAAVSSERSSDGGPAQLFLDDDPQAVTPKLPQTQAEFEAAYQRQQESLAELNRERERRAAPRRDVRSPALDVPDESRYAPSRDREKRPAFTRPAYTQLKRTASIDKYLTQSSEREPEALRREQSGYQRQTDRGRTVDPADEAELHAERLIARRQAARSGLSPAESLDSGFRENLEPRRQSDYQRPYADRERQSIEKRLAQTRSRYETSHESDRPRHVSEYDPRPLQREDALRQRDEPYPERRFSDRYPDERDDRLEESRYERDRYGEVQRRDSRNRSVRDDVGLPADDEPDGRYGSTARDSTRTSDDSRNRGASSSRRGESRPPKPAAELLKEAVDVLEKELNDPKIDQDKRMRQEVNLRLLRLALSSDQEALAPVKGLDATQQSFLKNQLYSLRVFLDRDNMSLESHRATASARFARMAADEIAGEGKLDLRNVAFCQSVSGYGFNQEFKLPATFRPKEDVLLYVELENFKSLETKEGFETEIAGNYSIRFKSTDTKVSQQSWEYNLPTDKLTCRNRRRDYFVAYRIYMPSNIEPGDYQLELMLTDNKANKSANAVLDFTVAGARR